VINLFSAITVQDTATNLPVLYEKIRHQLNIRLNGVDAEIRYALSFQNSIVNKKVAGALAARLG